MFRSAGLPQIVRALGVAVAASLLTPVGAAWACPFCCAPSLTLAEIVDQSDVVLLVERSGGTKPDRETAGETEYKIVRALEDGTRAFEEGDTVALARYRHGENGELSLLTGVLGPTLEWSPPTPVNDAIVRYVENAPPYEQATTERLAYYVNHLEDPEQAIASDAFAEFANARYEDIVRVRDKFPRDRLRKWIESDETTPNRIALYGLLLGLCGNDDDARFLRGKVLEPTTELRLGIEGVMSGYVLLAGEQGLSTIEESKFKADALVDDRENLVPGEDGRPQLVPASEIYAGLQTLRFLHQYEKGVVPSERLNQSMHLLLDHPGFADSAIADLARWKDWSVIERLVKVYGTKGYEAGTAKRAIIRYLTAAIRDVPEQPDERPGAHVAAARAGLESLRQRDRETVDETLKFLQLLIGL